MLLYRTLRQFLRLALGLYYVDVQVTGRSNVPAEGPVILAANHPNSIMDTIILGTQVDRPISYMARSGLFRNPLVGWLFGRCGVIPIYRTPASADAAQQVDGAAVDRNEASFRKAYELLEQGGALGIFPEGRNSMERSVLDIKTGTARIGLGAEARRDFALDVAIVPVGLNFVDRDEFLSSVLVRFGEPIRVRDWAEAYREDPREAVRSITEEIQRRLRDEATHIDGDRVVDLVRDIHTIYGRRLLDSILSDRERSRREVQVDFEDLRDGRLDDDPLVDDLLARGDERGFKARLFDEVKATPDQREDLETQFWLKRRIADAVAYYQEVDPELVRQMRIRIWRYKDHLRQVHLRHDFIDRPPETLSFRKEALRLTSYAVAFALPAAWGFVHNVGPYMAARALALRADDEAKRAFTALFVSAAAFPLMYAAWAAIFWLATGGAVWALVAYLLSLPLAGFFFLRYRRQLAAYRGRILTRTLFQTERALVQHLIRERERLVEDFVALRLRFVEAEERAQSGDGGGDQAAEEEGPATSPREVAEA